ncbi:MAG: oxidoreductase, partial [Actinomycetota bacterium]|nr:oxidoreductase [Actinomycetota bacterium]
SLPFPGGRPNMHRRPTDDEVIDLAYAQSRMPLDEVRRSRMRVHPDRALVVQPAAAVCTARFTLAPDDLMAELAGVHAQRDSCATLGVSGTDYPFRLVSRRMKHVVNSLGCELPALARKGTTNPAYMNPADVGSLGLLDGDLVTIASPRASLTAVVQAAADVRRGVVSMAHSFGGSSLADEQVRDIGAPTNRLVSTDRGYDAVTGMVVQSAIPVSVTRAPATRCELLSSS